MRKCGRLCRPTSEQTCAWLYVYISMHVFAFGLCVVRLWFVGSGSSPGVQKIRIQEGTQTHYQNLTFRAIWLLFLGSSVVGVLGAAQAPRKSGSRKAPRLITKTLRFVSSGCFFLARAWRGFWEQPRCPENQDPGRHPNSLPKPYVSYHLVAFSCLERGRGVLGAAASPDTHKTRRQVPKLLTKTLRFVPSGCFLLPRAWRGFWEQPRRQKIMIQEGTQTHY